MTPTQIMLIVKAAAVIIDLLKAKKADVTKDDLRVIADSMGVQVRNDREREALDTVIDAIVGIFKD